MRFCRNCKKYTLKEICANCGSKTANPHPPSFSPLDKYGAYRRIAKKNNL